MRRRTSRLVSSVVGSVRRFVVGLSQPSGLWHLDGYLGIDSEQERSPDTEVFPGVGFYSRPKVDGAAEAIVVYVGADENHPVIVATRDKTTQLQLDRDETAIFNSTGAKVHITKDGDVIVQAKAGREVKIHDGSGAVALAKKSELDALVSTFNSHVHALTIAAAPGSGGTGTAAAPSPPASSPAGTSVLKGK
jgi:phage gp45-like